VLAEHLHDTPETSKLATVSVFLLVFGKPGLLRSSVDCGEPVGGCLIRAEDTEGVHIPAHYFGKKCASTSVGDAIHRSCSVHFDRIVAKVRQIKLFAQKATVRGGLAEMRRVPDGASSCSSGMSVPLASK